MSTNLVTSERHMRKTRRISGRVTVSGGVPAVTQGTGFTLTDTAAGKVTINITKPGRRLLSAVATPIENTDATGFSCKIMGSPSASAVLVGIYQHDGTDSVLVDNVSFFFDICISDVAL